MSEKTPSSVPQKPIAGCTRSDPSSTGSKYRATQSFDKNVPGVFEMARPIEIPYSRSVEMFSSRDTTVEGKEFLDIGKQNSGWSRR